MLSLQQQVDWDSLAHVLCGLILLGRLGDIISTWLITPKLDLEANPIVRRLGWRFAVLTVLICLVPYVVDVWIAVILVPPFLMVSGSNIGKIWIVRALGEKQVLQQSIETARRSTFGSAATCTVLSGSFFILTGLVLVYLVRLEAARTQVSLLTEAFGYGVCTFGLAILIHGTIHVRRIFKLAAQDGGDAPGETSPL
ncbi:MAG: hypothetical protein V3U11_06750 [Planctomycetota bacterium]